MVRSKKLLSTVLLALTAVFASPASAVPYTYQGELSDGGMPVNGFYTMRFTHFTAETGGVQVGLVEQISSIQVVNGRFTRLLDPFVGVTIPDTLWLQIEVRPDAGSTFTTLSRQRVTPAPLALRSINDRWSPAGTGNVATDPGITNVLVNRSAPIFSDSILTLNRTVTTANQLAGMYVDASRTDAIPYYGWAAGGVGLGEARVDGTTGLFHMSLNGVTRVAIASTTGNVGIGLIPDTSAARLQVEGSTRTSGETRSLTFAYAGAQTRVYGVPPEAFQARDQFSLLPGSMGSSTGIAFLDASVATGALVAPVNLPNGAVVTGVDAIVIDNSAAADLSVRVFRRPWTGTGYDFVATTTTSGASAAVATLPLSVTASNATINNDTFAYNVNVFSTDWQGSIMGVKGVKIRYTVTSPD